MKSLKGTKTEVNLQAAFAGECQARVKYDYFASQARKDGYEQIASIFDETSNNEREHAKIWFKYLHGGVVPKTSDNLLDAADAESYEWHSFYTQFADDAREEGFDEIADKFEKVAAVEKEHEARYRKLLTNVTEKLVFSRDGDAIWQCRNCGNIIIGKNAPNVCPVCDHEQAYYQLKEDNF